MSDLPIAIVGDAEFVKRHMEKLESEGNEREVDVTIQEPTPTITDAQYRAALNDVDVPEPVKKAIRQYFKEKKKLYKAETRPTPEIHHAGFDKHGKAVPLRSSFEYRKPNDMSARQFKKERKARFREWRQNARNHIATTSQTSPSI